MRYYAVIDTNVLVSAMFGGPSVPWSIIKEALEGRIVPLLNDGIIAEYREVLNRRKFHFDKGAVEALVNDFIKRGIHVDVFALDETLPDPKDVVFYAVVMEARGQEDKEESYLVTGNTKHFPAKYFIVTPRQMLDIMTGEEDVTVD